MPLQVEVDSPNALCVILWSPAVASIKIDALHLCKFDEHQGTHISSLMSGLQIGHSFKFLSRVHEYLCINCWY